MALQKRDMEDWMDVHGRWQGEAVRAVPNLCFYGEWAKALGIQFAAWTCGGDVRVRVREG